MRPEALGVEPIDDDFTSLDVHAERFVSDVLAMDRDHEGEGDWLRSLAGDVTLLSRREWPKARASSRRRRG